MKARFPARTVAVPLVLCLLASAAAAADDRYFLAGSELARQADYSYVGLVLQGPMRAGGRGLMQRYWLDHFGYEYDGAPGHVKARAHGAEAALGYGASSAAGWWSVYLGLRYTDTTLTPDDASAKARGAQTGVKLQLEADQLVSSGWRAGAIVSYVSKQDAYWSRLRLMHSATSATTWGIEAIAAGNSESRWRAAGVVLSLQPAKDWSVALKTGYRAQSGESHGAYGGLEVGLAF
jgi:hypothetical protein